MDRRTLLAFVLAAVVIGLWSFLFPPQQPQRSAPAQVAGGHATPPQIPTSREEPGETEHAFTNTLISSDAIDEPVAVRTDTYRAVVNPVGGVVREWILDRYTDGSEREANLVADPHQGLFRVAVVGPGSTIDLSALTYRVEPAVSGDCPGTSLVAASPGGLRVRLDYRFPSDAYQAELTVTLEGLENAGRDHQLELRFPRGVPVLERSVQQDEMNFASQGLVGKHHLRHMHRGGGGFLCGRPRYDGWSQEESGVVRWVGNTSRYFIAAAIPVGSPDGTLVFTREQGAHDVSAGVRLPLAIDGPTVRQFKIYAGPMEYRRLESFGVDLQRAVNFGYSLFVPLARLLLAFFHQVHRVLPNYGVVIIVLSVLLKVVFFPLTRKSLDSMKQMQVMKPEMDRIQAKFQNDPQKKQEALIEFYRKNKINPMSGCLPMLVQIPFFFALFSVLNTSIELRKAPFVLWIKDLSSPDEVARVAGLPIHILPLLMMASSIAQARLTPTPPQQATMAYTLPIVFSLLFYNSPSGLALYWTVMNILQIGQQVLMNKSNTRTPVAA